MSPRAVLITGASRGIGEAIAKQFRMLDWQVLAPSREELDLASAESVRQYCEGLSVPVDALVNNAGINTLASWDTLSPEHWDEMLRIDLTAPLELTQFLAPGMKARGWGRVLNISSIFSLVTKERRLTYSTVKAGLNGMTRSLALELAPYNVLVNSLCPGYVETALTRANNAPEEIAAIARSIPVGRLAQPEEIARVAAFLCSEENTYLTGQTLAVDGGFLLR
jgi:3-oxoacyl-[acyl-carrier protein] reductase